MGFVCFFSLYVLYSGSFTDLFCNLNMMCLGVMLYVLMVGIHRASLNYRLTVSIKFGNYSDFSVPFPSGALITEG